MTSTHIGQASASVPDGSRASSDSQGSNDDDSDRPQITRYPYKSGPCVDCGELFTGTGSRQSNVVPLHKSQKGFVDEPGCSVNVFLLNEVLKAAKKSGKLAGVLIDVSKAFDTVPHSLLRKTLKAHGVPEALTRFIMDTYRVTAHAGDAGSVFEACRNGDIGRKCQSVGIVARSKTWFMKDPEVSLGEVKIPSTDAGEVVCYPGIDVSIWPRAPGGDVNKKTLEFVQALGRARLKPSQKVVLLKGYVLPKLFYELQMGFPRVKTLNGLDLIIREEVKSWLKLPATTSDAFFYTLNEDGGLGLPRLQTNIPSAILRRGTAILNCKDRRVQAIVLSSRSMKRSCPSTKPQRIARHDTIRDALGEAVIKAGLSVAKDQSVGVGDDRLRPDLIIVDGTKSFIVDITVRYEWGLSLADADREKSEKYDRLRPAVDLLFSGTLCARVLPIVVGSLGTIPMTTVRNLWLLGLCSNKILGFFSRMALNRSIWMASDFMDGGGGVRERTGYARCGF
uniref:Uncharacterized protein n=1 Tax=Strigamia maritima TaxID=126957 RepID=T1ILN6_STRMM